MGGKGWSTRRRRRSDSNQKGSVAYARRFGISVEVISDAGRGVPDLICGFRGVNALVELKRPGDRAQLTGDEEKWHQKWAGQVAVCTSGEEIVALMMRLIRGHAEQASGAPGNGAPQP